MYQLADRWHVPPWEIAERSVREVEGAIAWAHISRKREDEYIKDQEAEIKARYANSK